MRKIKGPITFKKGKELPDIILESLREDSSFPFKIAKKKAKKKTVKKKAKKKTVKKKAAKKK